MFNINIFFIKQMLIKLNIIKQFIFHKQVFKINLLDN